MRIAWGHLSLSTMAHRHQNGQAQKSLQPQEQQEPFDSATARAEAQRVPLLASASPTIPGSATAAVLSKPHRRPHVPILAFHLLFLRGAAAIALTAAAILGGLGLLVYWATHTVTGGSYLLVLLGWIAFAEVPFYYWFKRHAEQLDAQPRPHRPDTLDPKLHFRRMLLHARSVSERGFEFEPLGCRRLAQCCSCLQGMIMHTHKFYSKVRGRREDWRAYCIPTSPSTPPHAHM